MVRVGVNKKKLSLLVVTYVHSLVDISILFNHIIKHQQQSLELLLGLPDFVLCDFATQLKCSRLWSVDSVFACGAISVTQGEGFRQAYSRS